MSNHALASAYVEKSLQFFESPGLAGTGVVAGGTVVAGAIVVVVVPSHVSSICASALYSAGFTVRFQRILMEAQSVA